MLLLWSRLAALALAATGGPVSASPLKALDNGLSMASRTEQVTSYPSLHPPAIPPTIKLVSIGRVYRPTDTVSFTWDPHTPLKQADVWIVYFGAVNSQSVCDNRGMLLATGTGSLTLPRPHAIPWEYVTGHGGKNAKVSAYLYFSFSPSDYAHDPGVDGQASKSFVIQNW